MLILLVKVMSQPGGSLSKDVMRPDRFVFSLPVFTEGVDVLHCVDLYQLLVIIFTYNCSQHFIIQRTAKEKLQLSDKHELLFT